MKSICRLVVRGSDEKDGLILGVLMKNQNLLKPGRVYELREILGEVILIDVGPQNKWINWGHDISDLLSHHTQLLFLTTKEIEETEEANGTD